MSEHQIRIDAWHRLGQELGYESYKEFKLVNSHDSIDCVWKDKGGNLIFIEVEMNSYSNQVWKNLTKGLHLNPKRIIFDCANSYTARKLKSVANRINCEVEIINRELIAFDYIFLKEKLKAPTSVLNNFWMVGNLEKFSTLIETLKVKKEEYSKEWKNLIEVNSPYQTWFYRYLNEIRYLQIKDYDGRSMLPEKFKIKLNSQFNGKIMGVSVEDIIKCNFRNIDTLLGDPLPRNKFEINMLTV